MKQNSSKKPVSLRKLNQHEKSEEEIYRTQLHSSWARMHGETVVEKTKREARENENARP